MHYSFKKLKGISAALCLTLVLPLQSASAGDILFGNKRLELYSTIPVSSFWAMNPPEELKQAVTMEGQYMGPVEVTDDDAVGTTIMQDGYMGVIREEEDGLNHLYVKGPLLKLREIHVKDPTFLPQNVEIIHRMHPASFVVLNASSAGENVPTASVAESALTPQVPLADVADAPVISNDANVDDITPAQGDAATEISS